MCIYIYTHYIYRYVWRRRRDRGEREREQCSQYTIEQQQTVGKAAQRLWIFHCRCDMTKGGTDWAGNLNHFQFFHWAWHATFQSLSKTGFLLPVIFQNAAEHLEYCQNWHKRNDLHSSLQCLAPSSQLVKTVPPKLLWRPKSWTPAALIRTLGGTQLFNWSHYASILDCVQVIAHSMCTCYIILHHITSY